MYRDGAFVTAGVLAIASSAVSRLKSQRRLSVYPADVSDLRCSLSSCVAKMASQYP